MKKINSYNNNYVNGQWIDSGSGQRLDILNPATNEVIAVQALADIGDINRAVLAAKECYISQSLSHLRPVERGRMVQKMGHYLTEHRDEIAEVLTLDVGKPLWESYIEVDGAARYFEYYGNQAETLEGRSIPLGDGYYDFTVYEPFGVSAHVIPWNYPLEMTARSLSAALATGNSCVVKTPELAPLSCHYLAKAAEYADLPRGAVNILCGLGNEAGAALVSHPKINQIVFTGSLSTGIAIASAAAKNIVPCILELGGKSAAIVWPDVDQELLLSSIRWGIYFNAGQVCSAMSRLILHEDIHDQVIDQVVNMAQEISTGPGIERTEFGMNMGAMISEQQRDHAEAMCQAAVTEGARPLTGGHKLNRPGSFLEPTVFDHVTPDMEIAQKEIFGPVLSVLKFKKDDEAIQIANSTDYGLVGGVFTRDIDRAMQSAQKIRAGQVFINEWYAGGVETPFGGYGKSGYGREKGREALWNYVQTKNIAIALQK